MIYENFWRRVVARFVDTAMFVPLSVPNHFLIAPELGKTVVMSWMIFLHLIFFVYSIYMHWRFGQTLGKMAAGVMVVNTKNRRVINLLQAVRRDSVFLLITLLSLSSYMSNILDGMDVSDPWLYGNGQPKQMIFITACLWVVAELVTMAVNHQCRALHDLMAGTLVVRVKKKMRF